MKLKVFKRSRLISDTKTVGKIISLIDKYGLNVVKIGTNCEFKSIKAYELRNKLSLSKDIIIQLKDTKIEFTTKYLEGKPTTYIFSLNDELVSSRDGLMCYKEFCRYHKITDVKEYENLYNFIKENWYNYENGKYVCSASPLIGYNEKYEGQELKDCYEYDLNSAYASVLLNKVPDLTKPQWGEIKVKKGYVGFLLNSRCDLVEPGYYADVVFPLIDSPEKLKEYCKKYYSIKKTTTGNDKKLAKDMLNFPIGYCQRTNFFFRSYVVNTCNKVIQKLLKENGDDILLWNTDAVFSRKPLNLNIGDEIGQWKVCTCDTIKYKGNNYQINDELPTYRGVAKAWFKRFELENNRPFDILRDTLPTNECNLYEWDWNKLELRRRYE